MGKEEGMKLIPKRLQAGYKKVEDEAPVPVEEEAPVPVEEEAPVIPVTSEVQEEAPEVISAAVDMSKPAASKKKVKDQFPERKTKVKKEEGMKLIPKRLQAGYKKVEDEVPVPVEEEEEEEDAAARAVDKSKVKDHFAEREKGQKEKEKIIITPADLSGRGKKEVPEEDEEEKAKG